MARQNSEQQRKLDRSAREVILGDCMATLLFMAASSVFDELAVMLAVASGLSLQTMGLVVLITGLALYCPLSEALFGAGTSFNPLNNAAFAMAGRGRSAVEVGRMVAQAAGGAVGTAVALRWVPRDWQGRFRTFDQGPKPGVSLALGAACECILSFAINLVVLWSAHTRHKRLGYIAPLAATVPLVLAGWPTGPAMNSAWIFGWWVQFGSHSATQHVAIYWVAPLAGALAAGALWSALNTPHRRVKSRGARSPQKGAQKGPSVATTRAPAVAAATKKAN